MKKLLLRSGEHTLVDDDIYEKVNDVKWGLYVGASNMRYVGRYSNKQMISLHRLITGAKKGQIVDHKNGDTLDNRRQNLRICTHQQNMANRKVQKNNISGYKGVGWEEKKNRYKVRVYKDGREFHVGYYLNVIEAAKAFDKATKKLHGEFARTNF